MKAVLMAGGEGTRLRPLTSNQPKPMVPLIGRPLMEHIILLARRHGFEDIVVTVQFLASVIRTYFGDGSDLGVSLAYATEESPLGTAGSVKNAEDALDQTFLVISGDALTDIDLEKVVEFHRERKALATVVLHREPNPLEYGIVVTDEDGRVERFLEKPGWGEVFSDTVNTGIYVLEPEIFRYIPEGTAFDFSKDLFPMLLEKGAPIYGFIADGYWTDVGTIESYLQANRDALDGRVHVEIEGVRSPNGVWIGEGAVIDAEASVRGPAWIGEHVRVEPGAKVAEYSVVGDNTVVSTGAELARAVVGDNAYIGAGATLRGCIVGRNADVRRGARLEEGVVLGDEGFVGAGAVLQPNVKVYPFKSVQAGAVIARSIIWESQGSRTLFGERGVSGLINVDVSPDFAVRLAMAYATTLKRGSTVVTSRDASRAARTIKRAIIAGLNGSGLHVHDLEVAPTPVARFHLRSSQANGGVSVATVPGDPQSIEIRFCDADGADIDEGARRSIERIYFREDARRAFPDEIGELRFPPRALEHYQTGLLGTVDLDAIHAARPKAVVDCGFSSSALVLPGILGRLGADILTVNAYVDDSRPTLSVEERDAHLKTLGDLVKASRATFGALVDPAGERLWLVGEDGMLIPNDRALLLMVDLMCEARPGGRVVLPITAPNAAETIAVNHGCTVRRAKRSPNAIAHAALAEKASFAGTGDGAYLFGDFIPSFDGLAALCRLLEAVARTGVRLSERARELPSAHVAHRVVPTPFESRGTVMRHVAMVAEGDRTDDAEGIKVFDGDAWTLVIPDPEEAFTHVWSEGLNADEAEKWAEHGVAMVREALE